ncbi:hypothetical protein EBT16_00770 [bacterium]|nr:hypothetical protein [bacterium]
MEDSREKIIGLCAKIDNQAEHDYFLDLYERRVRFPKNENNLLVPYLLGLTDEFDASSEPAHIQGEFPDIDVDYLPIVQEYLRKEWCPKQFGRDRVVNIGNYGTFGIKSALLDMARVHGADYNEIQTITKNLQDKDEEGRPLTWEKALEATPDLAEYCNRNPDIADSARRLIDRNRGRGKHAGGTVISSIKIDDLVPVMIDTDGNPVSGWTEGLHDQDLQPVGLIKFDVLAVKDLLRIAHCCNLVKQRHPEVGGISAVPGHSDWTDTSYLNDPKALELANRAETRGIFQFDGEGMRKLIKAGGVDRFEDLVAYSALFRPATIGLRMHERYVERKRGREDWEDSVPECMRDILASTYGILIFQESVMRILNVVGDIPLIHCEKIRKAISKKKIGEFAKYKQMFLEKGSSKTGWPIESSDDRNMKFLWGLIENFSSYGFNKSMHQDTYIPTPEGFKKICDFHRGDKVYCINESGNKVETEVVNLHDHGSLECYSVVFDDGYEVICTLDHKFLTRQGQIPLHEILTRDISVLCEREQGEYYGCKKGIKVPLRTDFYISKIDEDTSVKMSKMPKFSVEGKGLDLPLFGRISDSAATRRSSKRMQRVQKIKSRKYKSKKCFVAEGVNLSMRTGFCFSDGDEATPKNLSGVSKLGLGRKDLAISMSDRVPNLGQNEQAPQGLQRMQEDKAGEYKGKKLKNKSIGGASRSLLNCCEENFGSTGDSEPEGGASKKMEGSEPREIRQKHRGCAKKPKAIKNGSVATTAVGLENEKDSLWKKSRAEMEASRYGEGQNMDRSGWILSLLRASKEQCIKRLSSTHGSTKRRYVEQRVSEEEGYNLAKGGYVVLPQQHRTNELGLVEAVPEHASISDTRNLVSRKIVRVLSVGRLQCYDLEVSCSTHNFILSNGVITSNSHAVAYTHTSSRLLYLKAHHPLEFFCSTLGLEGDEDKVKMYKREAERSGIKINRCDLNKSKVNYEIVGDEIYVGFSNIKGVGKEAAEKIVALQPFAGLPDFLNRFGTDKRIVEPLVCLGAFKDAPPNVLLEFYEDYKKWSKGNLDKEKRQMKRREELAQSIRSMLKDGCEHHADHAYIMRVFEEGNVSSMRDAISEEFGAADYLALVKKYAKSVLDFDHKMKFSKENSISFDNWKPSNRYPIEKWPNIFEIERKHYGFSWEHPIQKSPDYIGGHSFNIFKEDETIINAGVEVMITKKPQEKVSKNGNKYYYALVEDEDWNVEVVTFWSEDYARFKEDLEYWNEEQARGHFLRIRLTRPGSGFKSYTFESPPKAIRYKVIPSDKKLDMRLQIMQSPM